MSIMTRHILSALGIAALLSVVVPVIIFLVFPLNNWNELWERKVVDLPFAIFLPSLFMTVGILYGIIAGLYWKRQLQEVENQLYLLEQGRAPVQKDTYSTHEFSALGASIQKVYRHINDQVKISQKLANEKAVDQEKEIQKIISEERNRLARELHDSVSQQLFAASMLMSAITESHPEDGSKKQLSLVEGMIHQSQLEMRALLLHLRPVALKDKTLQQGIEELLIEMTQKVPMEITWKLDSAPLDKGIEDHLFRILQEAVSNTLRHAKATSLSVRLMQRDDLIIMQITDDGIGFKMEETKTGSYGLQNMNERALEIGGTMKMISVPNKGTKLEVKIPVTGGEKND